MHPAIDSSAYNKNEVNTEGCGGGKQEQVRLAKRPKAILKPYVSRWRLDSDDQPMMVGSVF